MNTKTTIKKITIVSWIALGLLFFLQTTLHVAAADHYPELYQTEETEPFLAVPYFDAAYRTSYMDNDQPNYGINGHILLYDGRIIPATNGACGYNDSYEPPLAIAYYAEPNNPNAECIWYEGHSGHDFDIAYEPILAAARGTVVSAGWTDHRNRLSQLGLFTEIEHGNGYYTRYGHMSAVITKTTDLFVTQGQIIGTSGNTGNSSGRHLHFETFQRVNGIEVFADPFRTTAYLWEEGLWFAGQWSGRRSQPAYDINHLVDSNDPENFKKGSSTGECPAGTEPTNCPFWHTSLVGGVNNSSIYTTYANLPRDYWVTWRPPEPGQYLVEAYIPENGINPDLVDPPSLLNVITDTLTWGARYCPYSTVYNDPIPYCVVVDQLGSQGRWIALGNVWFGDDADLVRLYDQTLPNAAEVELFRRVGVDALRFRGVILDETIYLPIVQFGENVITGQ